MEPNSLIPLVSVICETFNQEKYIRDCLEGFIKQKTDFIFEVLIHDDASTDKTQVIIKEYCIAHPTLIKPVFQKENQYSQGVSIWETIQYPRAQGKYIAFCEGDDYWTDHLKLQKQVDFLEANPECSAVFGNFTVYDENNGFTKTMKFSKHRYKMFDVMSGLMPGLHNICIRREVFEQIVPLTVNGDIQINYKCALVGQLAYLDENFSVYRITGHGLATSRTAGEKQEIAFSHWYQMHKELGFKHNRALAKYQSYLILSELSHIFCYSYLVTIVKLLRRYTISSYMFHVWRFYYAIQYVFVLFYNEISGRKSIYLKY